jgi:hypothetical protein
VPMARCRAAASGRRAAARELLPTSSGRAHSAHACALPNHDGYLTGSEQGLCGPEEVIMANKLGPIGINCDSPPYSVVQACRRIGIESPEDVRWCRMSHFLQQGTGLRQLFYQHGWKALLGVGRPEDRVCSCGYRLPDLEKYTFTFITGREASFCLGQCRRCHSIFWEEA